MQSSIYYFSGTGNSLKIAQDLSNLLPNSELFDISQLSGEVITNSKIVGIIFPVYVWGMPLIISDFISRLAPNNNTYYFAICNYASSPAGTLNLVRKQLKKRGIPLHAGYGIKMPSNYIVFYGAIKNKKQEKIFYKEEEKIKEIAENIKSREKIQIKNRFNPLIFLASLFYAISIKNIGKAVKKFKINNKCNGCGICVRVCPQENIKLVNSKPLWGDKCEQCMACLQWCPQEAIELGKRSKNKKRYHNPHIKLKSILKR